MKIRLWLLPVLIGMSSTLEAQNGDSRQLIDSLKLQLAQVQDHDSLWQISGLYAQIGRAYESIHRDSAIDWYQQHLSFLKHTRRTSVAKDSLIGSVYLDLSFLHAFIGYPSEDDIGKAYLYADTAYLLFEDKGYYEMAVRAYNNKGLTLINQNQYREAIEDLIQALELSDKLETPKKRNLAQQGLLLNIGKAYIGLEQWPLAMEYTQKAIAIDGIPRFRMIALNNLSAIYLQLEQPDSTLHYAALSYHLSDSLGDDYHKLLNRTNQAEAYLKLKDYESAKPIIESNIETSRHFEYPYGIAAGLNQLANYYGSTGDYQSALQVLKEAEPLAVEVADKELLIDTWENYNEVYSKLGRYEEAHLYQGKFYELRDSLNSVEKTKNFNELLVQFEAAQNEKKLAEQELKLAIQEASIAKRDRQLLFISGGIVILILGGLVIIVRMRQLQERKLQEALIVEKERGLEAIINATEDERKRISKDLHDGIGQKLTALRLALVKQAEDASEPKQKTALVEIAQDFRESAEELRQVSHQMMPRALMEQGLVPALEDLMESTFKHTDIQYRFEHFKIDRRYPERMEVSLYRITQELLNNSLKHAQASEIQVQLMELKGNLVLIVEDNGKGLGENVNKGQGLHNIKSRLDLLKGAVNYEDGGETGMLATVKIPLP
ncbi:MAG: sensor histidine kinase [Flavobacteriia bacterium]|nr:sensor histidine kinase [Flavobacteriia bacterium]